MNGIMLKVFRTNAALYWNWEIRIDGKVVRCGQADSYQKARVAAEAAMTRTDEEHSIKPDQEIRCGSCGYLGQDPCPGCREESQW